MVLEEEQLVNVILLELAELDQEADGTSQRPLNHKVLLASNLEKSLDQGGRRGSKPWLHAYAPLRAVAAGLGELYQ